MVYDEFTLMNLANEFARATVLAGQTVKRLEREGISADEARRLVVGVINAEEAAVTKGRRPFDEVRLVKQLRRLPGIF